MCCTWPKVNITVQRQHPDADTTLSRYNATKILAIHAYSPSQYPIRGVAHPSQWGRDMGCLFAHYSDVIINTMASQITNVSIICSIVCSGADQRKHQSSALLALCEGNPPPVTTGFPSQRASNAENVSAWWRHREFKGWRVFCLYNCTVVDNIVF